MQAEEVAVIQTEVSAKQKSTEEDLAMAEPMVEAAMAALNTLDKKDLGEAKTMSKPPSGVDDIFDVLDMEYVVEGASPGVSIPTTTSQPIHSGSGSESGSSTSVASTSGSRCITKVSVIMVPSRGGGGAHGPLTTAPSIV